MTIATLLAVCAIEARVHEAALETERLQARLSDRCEVTEYADRVRALGGTNVWTDALQAALDEHEIVVLPPSQKPYYVDRSVVVPSNRRIEAVGATIRLVEGVRTLLLRNRSTRDGTLAPIPAGGRDSNIAVVGGRWEDWWSFRAGHVASGRYDPAVWEKGRWMGVSTLFLFNNCDHLTIRDATFHRTSGFAVQTGDGDAHVYRNIRFDRCFADGLHLNGNLSRVWVKDVSGDVGDDLVALNAYDWLNSSVDFGPQRLILCEDLELKPRDGKSYPAIRIQPAKFRYADGSVVDCTISQVVFRRVRGISTFKMYLQTPRYAIGTDPEWSGIGSGRDIYFEDIDIDLAQPIDLIGQYATSDPVRGHFGAFEFGANLANVRFRNIDIRFHADRYPLSHLVTVGPKSCTVTGADGRLYEVFDPYVECHVEGVVLDGVRTSGAVPADLVHATSFDDVNGDGRSSGRGTIAGISRLPEAVEICDGWRISPVSQDPVVIHAAELLSRFLEDEKGVKVPVEPGAAGDRAVAVGVSSAAGERTSVVQAGGGRVSVEGGTPREAAQGCYRLIDMLRSSKGAEVESGRRTFTRMFSPRMTHSSVSIDSFPDEELDRIAMAGMDAVIVYVGRSPDITRAGKIDMNDLVRRAALRGLDVYVYAFDAKGATACDPTAPDAVEQYDRLYGGIVRNAPGLKGMVFVGESTAFASHLPDMGGFYWKREKGKHTFGFWPSLDWVDWLNAVKTALRRHRSDFDVVFWTYNWCAAPEKDRLELIRKIPADVTLLVTFEMGALPERYKGVPLQIDDYSICRPGPSAVFTSEAAVASSRGIRLLAMANTGGRTWDFGGAPYEPAPYAWLDRFRAIREAHEKFGLSGLMDSHHYGWHDGVVADLAKEAFTAENAVSDLEAQLYRMAVRRLGAEAAPKALAAWRDWSEAMRLHPADSCDQYGPLRVGPSFPFTLSGEELPKKPKGKWMFLRKDYALPLWRFPAMQELAQREISLWERGISAMDEAAEAASPDRRRAVRMEAALGRFCAASVRTMMNFRDFRKAAAASNVVDMVAAIARERENVRAAIPLFDENPSIGREPTMGVVADREHMEWKLRQLDDKERQIASSRRHGGESVKR